MNIKLVALDLDGTLIDRTGTIGSLTREVLLNARNSGIYVIVATGRSLLSTLPACECIRPHFIVASHGATAFDMENQSVMWAKTISREIVLKAVETIGWFDVWPRVHTLDRLYIAGPDRSGADMYANAYGERCLLVPDRRSLAREAVMLGVAGTDPDDVSLAFREVAAAVAGEASVHRGNAQSFDVVCHGASKLAAVAALASSLGIDRTQVAAFGDGLNDVELLRWAGLGMAVEGSPEEVVSAVSGRTIPDHDGVGIALREILNFQAR